ncbi:MAG: GNAT family N-acetyltransferase, partial [Halobacteriovoraceae bacterium]|nr:GNAT family N-acetyltransferase [Halobacteriovoraceae bacterium]
MNVKQIDAKDTYQLRNIVLRPNLPVKSCHFDHDKDESTFHLAAYIDDKLASIASFYMLNNDKLDDNFQYQLRGMATLVEYRAQGLSSALLRTAFPLIKKNHINTLWCNARSE